MTQTQTSSLKLFFSNVYTGKKIWLSGHTGFKGAWLAEWLLLMGAEVYGYALEPDTTPSLFNELQLASRLHHEVADIRDAEAVKKSILSCQPDFVFHLAAQPLVRRSYLQPLETYETNVMGTIHVLEALRALQAARKNETGVVSAVMVTTDKCYKNHEDGRLYAEEDALGGHDPYSSSKAMAEIAVAAYQKSFFKLSSQIRLASARAGNVVGGGDWAEDRIIPDCVRALEKKESILVRNPSATRPWQHVLEPLSGYLWLGARLAQDEKLATSFNFGPTDEGNHCVRDVVERVLQQWPGEWHDGHNASALHEAKLLGLSINKASSLLGWKPVWNFERTIEEAMKWYCAHKKNPSEDLETTHQQIISYCNDAKKEGLCWAK
ncbi:MAG: CDP-glucose 4,6-dehydratase [Chthoniobacterales bacterium]